MHCRPARTRKGRALGRWENLKMSNTATLLPNHARIDVSFADCGLIASALRCHREVAALAPEEIARLIDIEARFDALYEAAKRGGHVSEQQTYTADEVRAWLRERAATVESVMDREHKSRNYAVASIMRGRMNELLAAAMAFGEDHRGA